MKQQQKAAVALGLFDGVHMGHRAVLKAAAEKKAEGYLPCAFTFPAEMVAFKKKADAQLSAEQRYLYTTEQKQMLLLEECGMEQVLCPQYADVCGMDGESFVKEILLGQLNAGVACCGGDFRFGKHAGWGVKELEQFGNTFGFSVIVVPDVCCGEKRISSFRIRRAVANGDMEAAAAAACPYFLFLPVVHGQRLGRTIGFPTLNQVFEEGQLVPKYGVYASETYVEGSWYPSVTNIGMKPTVGYTGNPLAETYIDGFSGDLYGQTLRVRLKRMLRQEQHFDSVEALTVQLQKDLQQSRLTAL